MNATPIENATHTPPPWEVKWNRVTVAILDSAGNYITENVRAAPNQRANALLIAAAPRLYEACAAAEAALCNGGTFPINGETWHMLKKALLLARGG